jgi:hypothetical protein
MIYAAGDRDGPVAAVFKFKLLATDLHLLLVGLARRTASEQAGPGSDSESYATDSG